MRTPIASPEVFHRPHVVFAPDNKVDSDVSCQQSPLLENALATPQQLLGNLTADLILTEEHHQTEQNDDSSLGLLAQGAVDFVKQVENPQGEISYEEEQHALFSFNNTKVMRERRAMWQETGFIPPLAGGQERKGRKKDGPLNTLTEDRSLLPKVESKVYGKSGVDLRRDLSPNAKKLLDCLIEERGDVDLLPMFAAEDNFDLDAAVDEMRALGLLDESDPKRIRLISRSLK